MSSQEPAAISPAISCTISGARSASSASHEDALRRAFTRNETASLHLEDIGYSLLARSRQSHHRCCSHLQHAQWVVLEDDRELTPTKDLSPRMLGTRDRSNMKTRDTTTGPIAGSVAGFVLRKRRRGPATWREAPRLEESKLQVRGRMTDPFALKTPSAGFGCSVADRMGLPSIILHTVLLMRQNHTDI